MVVKKVNEISKSGLKITLLDGLSDLEQASIAREYENRTHRPSRCWPCMEARHAIGVEAEAGEPAGKIVAVLQRPEGSTPVCEVCYSRI